MESHGSKAVRDVRKKLVVQVERELSEVEKKVIQTPGVGEEERFGETMDEEVEKSRCRRSSYGRPSLYRTRGSVGGSQGFRVGRVEAQETTQPHAKSALLDLQTPTSNPPISKSAAKVCDSNLISTPSFANILYCPAFPHQAIR